MKYFTREWFDTRNGSNTYQFLNIAKEAENFSEEYFQSLYKSRLEEHLQTWLEMSKLTVDDVFPSDAWTSFSTVDQNGNFVDASTMVSAEEFEKIRQGILQQQQEAREKFVPVVYEEEKLTKEFHDNMLLGHMQYLESILPKDIIKDIADTRVFALNVVSEEIWERIHQFCSLKEERAYKVEKEFQEYYNRIYPQLPEKMQKYYGFHDCRVTGMEQDGSEITIGLDHSGGFSPVCKVIYHNAELLEPDNIVGATWLCDEIYPLQEGYELHTALQDRSGEYRFLTIRAGDVDFITD